MTGTKRKKVKSRRLRPGITETSTGLFLARIRLPKDPVSGQRGGSSKTHETIADAEQWLIEERARIARGQMIGKSNVRRTLAAFIRDFYQRVRKTTRGTGVISERTAQDDLALVELYVLKRAPGLAETSLANLSIPLFRDHFRNLSESGLAAATVSRVARILRARLAYAVESGELRQNPMDSPLISVSGKKKRTRPILSGVQAGALFDALPQTTEGAYLATLLWCGVRPSEGAALLWDEDVQLEQRTLTIQRALVRVTPDVKDRGKGTAWSLSTTKTGTSRIVPIPDALVAMLRRHRAQQAQDRLTAGREYQNNGLVFASPFGKPLHIDLVAARFLPTYLHQAAMTLAGFEPVLVPPGSRSHLYKAALAERRKQEDEAMRVAGIPKGIGLYSLRHCFASRLASEGVPIKTIQELLGHSSIVTTLTSYVHTDADAGRKALEKLEVAFASKAKKLVIA